MINNGVHWASDYPLGIGMGYVFGKVVSNYGHQTINGVQSDNKISLFPIFFSGKIESIYGLQLDYRL